MIQKIVARAIRFISDVLQLQVWGHSWTTESAKAGARSTWSYFLDFGPAVLVIRNGKVSSLMGACTMIVRYASQDQKGRVISCKPLLMTLGKDDSFVLGRVRANREYERLEEAARTVTADATCCS